LISHLAPILVITVANHYKTQPTVGSLLTIGRRAGIFGYFIFASLRSIKKYESPSLKRGKLPDDP
jgi:hypothetical protein